MSNNKRGYWLSLYRYSSLPANELLAIIDAADPIRALWEEMVGAVAIAYAHGYESGHQDTCDGYYRPERKLGYFVAEHDLLARARALDANNAPPEAA